MTNILENIKMRKESIYIFCLFVVTFLLYCIFNNPNIVFFSNIIIVVWILAKAKISFFSIKIILCNYILFSAFSEYNFGASYGLLHIEANLYYDEMNLLIFLYNIIMLFIVTNSSIIKLEQEQIKNKFEIPKIAEYIFGIIAIVATIIALPTLPFLKDYDRFNALLPGNAWNHIAIVALIFMIPNLKKSKFGKIVYAFVIFWFLSHYERVDIIGLLIGLIIVMYHKREKKLKVKNYIALAVLIIVMLGVMNTIGEKRMGIDSVSVGKLIEKVFVQNTASDVAYVFNSAIDYNETHMLLLGKTYITYLIKAIPFLDTELRTDTILQEEYSTAGGDFFLDEPLMNFGWLGVILYPIIEMGIYLLLLRKKSKYRFFVWVFLIMTTFRTTWYGLLYIEKGLIYFIPILYFILYFIEKNRREKYEEKKDTNIQ